MRKSQLFHDFLSKEGFRPTVSESGSVIFKHEGGNFFLAANEDDVPYFQLVFPGIWAIESDAERARAHVAASKATSDTKVAKVYVSGDNVYVAVELFLPDIEQFSKIFDRALRVCRIAAKGFADEMRS
jgi:hypothetical protein